MNGDQDRGSLVQFWAKNVRCYREEVVLSMEATRLANEAVVRSVATTSVTPARLLPVAGVFGANASGKSAILSAMFDMRWPVVRSFRGGAGAISARRVPFLLEGEYVKRPSEYGVEVILNGVLWRYGFEIDDDGVVGEFAVHYPKGREALVFDRRYEETEFGPPFRAMGKALATFQRRDTLLLSIVGAIDDNPVTPLFAWFDDSLEVVDSDTQSLRALFTAELSQHDEYRTRVLELLRAADLGVTDTEVQKADAETMDRMRKVFRVMLGKGGESDVTVEEEAFLDRQLKRVRLMHVGTASPVLLDPEYESVGTRVWVGLIGPILRAIDKGSLLLIDELDGSLHPLLVERLVTLFQDPLSNSHCAQLVFNAHDLHLFSVSEPFELGRDQVWTVEKGSDGASRIQSIAEYKPRGDESLGRRYLQGRYGGIPKLNPRTFGRAVSLEDVE